MHEQHGHWRPSALSQHTHCLFVRGCCTPPPPHRDDEADGRYGMHVCIGGSSETTVGGLSGGLAFTGAWGQLGPALQPVLVFPV